MKKIQLKRMMAGFWAAAFVVMSSVTALAADSVEVDGSGEYASTTNVNVYQDNDLFSNMKELMPGATVTNTVEMKNLSSREVTMYLRAYPDFVTNDNGGTAERNRTETSETGDKSTADPAGKTFRDDILDQIDMTLTLGDKVIYKGSADGKTPEAGYTAMTTADYGIKLGAFAAGEEKKLEVKLVLPGPKFDNSFASSFDAVDWVFCAEGTTPDNGGNSGGHGGGGGGGTKTIKDPSVPLGPGDANIVITDPDVPLSALPKLGDNGISGYVFGILLALLIACSALYMRKRCSRS
ncbi:MAG: hypothetical protein MR562_00410 [Clostridiaceae bacterium]|nr:hypothetical protein [Clostridiaceae bacterium]